jgi:hypothetical protein
MNRVIPRHLPQAWLLSSCHLVVCAFASRLWHEQSCWTHGNNASSLLLLKTLLQLPPTPNVPTIKDGAEYES